MKIESLSYPGCTPAQALTLYHDKIETKPLRDKWVRDLFHYSACGGAVIINEIPCGFKRIVGFFSSKNDVLSKA